MRLNYPVTALLAVLVTANLHAQTRALRFAAVVDGTGRVVQNGVVIVTGDKISQVIGPRDGLPAVMEVLDLTRYTAIPGLIDAHTHMTYSWDPSSGTDPWRQPQRTPDQIARFQRAN